MPIGRNDNCSGVPQDVRTALPEAAKRLRKGLINQREYQSEVDRISRLQLLPQGFTLVVRDLAHGAIRFVIRANATGEVCETIDYAPE